MPSKNKFRLGSFISVGMVAAALVATPYSLHLNQDVLIGESVAFAKGGKGKGKGQANAPGQNRTSRERAVGKLRAKVHGQGGTQMRAAQHRSRNTGISGGSHGRHHGNFLGNNHRAVASSLGRLNAAHASPNARLHAASNSVVGLLATYEAAVKESMGLTDQSETLNQAIADLQAQIDQSGIAELEAAAVDATENAAQIGEQATLAATEAERLSALAEEARQAAEQEPDNEALASAAAEAEAAAETAANQAAQLSVEAQAAEAAAAEAQAEAQATAESLTQTQEDLAAAEAELGQIEESLEAAAIVEAESLAAAANKPITDEVTAAVNQLLGLDQETTSATDSGSPVPTEPEADLEGGDEPFSPVEDVELAEGDEDGFSSSKFNAGLGNGGEDGDPGQSGVHNAVASLPQGEAAGELDDSGEQIPAP